MLQERSIGIIEEIGEVQSLAELKALWCFGQHEDNEYGDAQFVPHFQAAVARLRNEEIEEVRVTTIEEPMDVDVAAQVAALEAQIAALKGEAPAQANPPVKPVTRGGKRYRLLSTDVSWSTKPQVRALMEVLAAHVEVGGELSEATIVEAMVANEAVLETRQGGKRIWDYYKGNHAEGLRMHGNVEVV